MKRNILFFSLGFLISAIYFLYIDREEITEGSLVTIEKASKDLPSKIKSTQQIAHQVTETKPLSQKNSKPLAKSQETSMEDLRADFLEAEIDVETTHLIMDSLNEIDELAEYIDTVECRTTGCKVSFYRPEELNFLFSFGIFFSLDDTEPFSSLFDAQYMKGGGRDDESAKIELFLKRKPQARM